MIQGWEIKRLEDLCQIELGKTPYRGDKSFWDTEKETGNVWLSIADMLNTDGDVVSDSKEYITDKAAKVSKIVKKGTLLLSFKLTLGRLAFAGKNLFTNEAIAALAIKNEKVIDKYFLYQFLSLFDWDAASEGDVKVKGKTLNKAKLKEIEVHFPKSLHEQQRIVAILDEAFAAIAKAKANAEQNLNNAKELFESYLQSVFENKGEDWEEKTIGEMCDLIDSLHKTPKYIKDGGFPMVRVTEIKYGNLDISGALRVSEETYKEFSKKHIPKIGDIVFSRVGASFGVSSLVVSNQPFCLGQNTVFIIPKLNSLFCYYFLNSRVARNQMNKLVAGAAQPTISLKSIRELIIPFPSLIQQKSIVHKIDALSTETKKLETIYQQKINDLEELKKSVLQKAFNGDL